MKPWVWVAIAAGVLYLTSRSALAGDTSGDTIASTPFPGLQQVTLNPSNPSPGLSNPALTAVGQPYAVVGVIPATSAPVAYASSIGGSGVGSLNTSQVLAYGPVPGTNYTPEANVAGGSPHGLRSAGDPGVM